MRHIRARALAFLLTAPTVLAGCEVASFFDPSRTGRFEHTPTTIPILNRIDVVEREHDPWARAVPVSPEDLLPSDLTYRLRPSDLITVEVFELVVQGQVWGTSRRIDPSGYFRIPAPVGDVRGAGLTVQEFQDELIRIIDEKVLRNPVVNVTLEEGTGFQYTIYGAIGGTGLYGLRRPDLRLLDALAQAGGAPLSTQRIYIIRQVPLTGEVIFEPARRTPDDPATFQQESPAVDIEDLIRQLEERERGGAPPADPGDVRPGLFSQDADEPPIDIDDLEPVRVAEPPDVGFTPATTEPAIGPMTDRTMPVATGGEETFIYLPDRGVWVRVGGGQVDGDRDGIPTPGMFLERIIEIPFQRLKHGESSYNVVVRPNDRIYVREADIGVVYIDGEIQRPGVYNLPSIGRLTLSRLVAAAGGLSPLAIPERVDLTRVVGDSREATVRLNMAAIRKRTQPDLYLRPDDHIIIGTSWIATPVAIIRNGFRATYGFGFLLDRNFGNDVFGAPPTSRGF